NEDTLAFAQRVGEHVSAVGYGCGLPAELESWFRFLVDPAPPTDVQIGADGLVHPTGTDAALLAQRSAFLRTDSVVLIVMVTGSNDCSIIEQSQFYYAFRSDITLPSASAVCEQDPSDPCCHSCGTAAPAACAPDPSCTQASPHSPQSDPMALR